MVFSLLLGRDIRAMALRAISISSFVVQLGFNRVMIEEFALLVWALAGLAMASEKYQRKYNV